MNSRFYLVSVFLIVSIWGIEAVARDTADPYWDYRDEGETGVFEYDDSKDVPWQESVTELPLLPPDDELLELPLTKLPEKLVAYTHMETISISKKDAVTRYWLVIRGQGGGYNATYEGLRCSTGEYKVYGHGYPIREPKVKLAKQAQWRNLVTDVAGYRRELGKNIICAGVRPKTKRQIRASVRGEYHAENPYATYID